MKAVRCNAWGLPDTLVVEDIATPQPQAGEVLLEVNAASVNYPDVLIVQKKYQMQPELPFTPGTEIAGTVRALGEGVTKVKLGDRVIAFVGLGGFAELAVAAAKTLIPIPPGISDEIAASFTMAYGTSHHAVIDRGELKAGQTMLVLGAAGGVGLAAVEIGKAIGARVIAAASSDEKLAVCKAHGADVLINYTTQDLRAAVKSRRRSSIRPPQQNFGPGFQRLKPPREIADHTHYHALLGSGENRERFFTSARKPQEEEPAGKVPVEVLPR